jgi:segregation and condensation protein A
VSVTPESTSHFFEVRLDSFDGPIDLLLHLVKKNELPIEKLSLYQITSQYFECLERMRHLDLEIAGEYLVIASTLLSIKASILLNEPVELVVDEDGVMVDPHQVLLQRIREAAIYKDGAMQLGERNILGLDVFENKVLFDGITPLPAELKNHEPLLLAKAFKKVLEKNKTQGPLFTITVDSVSIVDRMMSIVDMLSTIKEPVSFERIVTDKTNRGSVISGFLALLELAKRGIIYVAQSEVFHDIEIGLVGTEREKGTVPVEVFESEFDEKIQNG